MTEVDLANLVLDKLGQSPISEFGENRGTGIFTYANYLQERDSLLRTIPWNFARKWITLAQLLSAPILLDILPNSSSPGNIAYTAAYQLPNDYLRLYRFSPKDTHWRIVGRAIYTDAIPAATQGILLGLQPLGSDGPDNQPPSSTNTLVSTIGIEYIYKVNDPNIFDPKFTESLIWKIVKSLSFGATALVELYRIAAEEYKIAIADAAAVNGMENWPDEFWNDDLTSVRYGYSSLNSGM